MTPAVFGFAVAVHPTDPDTAWLVPAVKDETRIPVDAKVVVSRTRDAGKTWEVLDRGLPAPPAYDIAFRHALDVDDQGTTLAMGQRGLRRSVDVPLRAPPADLRRALRVMRIV